MIGVSNLEDKIEKAILANFVNNVKELLNNVSSNYSIVIDKGEHDEDYVGHIYRDIFSGPNSTFKNFIESTKDDCYTGT